MLNAPARSPRQGSASSGSASSGSASSGSALALVIALFLGLVVINLTQPFTVIATTPTAVFARLQKEVDSPAPLTTVEYVYIMCGSNPGAECILSILTRVYSVKVEDLYNKTSAILEDCRSMLNSFFIYSKFITLALITLGGHVWAWDTMITASYARTSTGHKRWLVLMYVVYVCVCAAQIYLGVRFVGLYRSLDFVNSIYTNPVQSELDFFTRSLQSSLAECSSPRPPIANRADCLQNRIFLVLDSYPTSLNNSFHMFGGTFRAMLHRLLVCEDTYHLLMGVAVGYWVFITVVRNILKLVKKPESSAASPNEVLVVVVPGNGENTQSADLPSPV